MEEAELAPSTPMFEERDGADGVVRDDGNAGNVGRGGRVQAFRQGERPTVRVIVDPRAKDACRRRDGQGHDAHADDGQDGPKDHPRAR